MGKRWLGRGGALGMSVKVGLRAPKSNITPPEVVETVLPTPLLNHALYPQGSPSSFAPWPKWAQT
jgi:hypothetical protein